MNTAIHHPHPLRGYLYIASATFLWGVSATLGRAAFTGRLLRGGAVPSAATLPPIDPLILSQSRVTFCFLALLLILAATRGVRRLRLPWADVGRTFLLGTLGIAGSNYFYYLAIERTNVATAIILQYTAPIWVLLYAIARRLQKPTLERVAAVGLAVAGSGLVINIFHGGGFRNGFRIDAVGVTAALLAAVSFAFYNVFGHGILMRYDRWTVLLYTTFGASLFWLAVNPPWKIAAAHHSGGQWLFLLVFALVSALAPFSLYAAGLQHLDPTRAIVASCLEPVFAIAIAAMALGEVVQPIQAVGVALVLLAIVVVQMPSRGKRGEDRKGTAVLEPIE
jgi:drug/metabolite transporter (DMT)-like permease